jgi:hypothetical protein
MSAKQIVILVVAVVGICAGAGLLFALMPTIDKNPNLTPADVIKAPLEVSPGIDGIRYEESYTAGHHPFPYRSIVDKPVKVGVHWKNCRCASVQICVAPDDWKSLPPSELIKKAEDPSLSWTPLEKDAEGFEVPPHAFGWVRVGWKADKNGMERFKADLWLYEPESGLSFPLEIGVLFLEPVQVRWSEDLEKSNVDVGRFGPGDRRSAKFMLFSVTRPQFTITPDPIRNDPCVTYGEPIPLKQADLDRLTMQSKHTTKAGYEVEVTISERVGDTQLDIGPFLRTLRWKSNASREPVSAQIRGIVVGEVSMVSGDPDLPRIDMASINPERPIAVPFVLESENPAVELTFDEKQSADFLKVDQPDGKAGKLVKLAGGEVRKKWDLSVTYRPESGFRGSFPDRERKGYERPELVFRITHAGAKNEQERYLKIPVRGQVRNK